MNYDDTPYSNFSELQQDIRRGNAEIGLRGKQIVFTLATGHMTFFIIAVVVLVITIGIEVFFATKNDNYWMLLSLIPILLLSLIHPYIKSFTLFVGVIFIILSAFTNTTWLLPVGIAAVVNNIGNRYLWSWSYNKAYDDVILREDVFENFWDGYLVSIKKGDKVYHKPFRTE